MNTDTEDNKILEWKDATPEEQKTAAIAAEKIKDRMFFSYNLPLQIWIPDESDRKEALENGEDPCGSILNYMPRRESCANIELSEFGFDGSTDRENMREFCDTTITILKHLAHQWELFRDGKIDCVYYPNSEPTAD